MVRAELSGSHAQGAVETLPVKRAHYCENAPAVTQNGKAV